jgi:hypothetical protein
MTTPFDPEAIATRLLDGICPPSPVAVQPLPGGRNNKVWKVTAGAQAYLMKKYYWSAEDPRDRLGQEWAFLTYLREIGCTLAPYPYACDRAARAALLEFIPGAPPPPLNVGDHEIQCAADFFLEMNKSRDKGKALPPVSEACFSLAEHLATTAIRVERLAFVEPSSDCHREVCSYVAKTLHPLWKAIERQIRQAAGSALVHSLGMEERCLSPSDFGFHNTLCQPNGTLRFLDFEYAGWDDPAKTIIDFCNQPDLLLPEHLANRFRERCLASLQASEALALRIRGLEPLYQLKWACICLNLFLPGRGFTDPRPERSPQSQLARARTMAARASKSLDSIPPRL